MLLLSHPVILAGRLFAVLHMPGMICYTNLLTLQSEVVPGCTNVASRDRPDVFMVIPPAADAARITPVLKRQQEVSSLLMQAACYINSVTLGAPLHPHCLTRSPGSARAGQFAL